MLHNMYILDMQWRQTRITTLYTELSRAFAWRSPACVINHYTFFLVGITSTSLHNLDLFPQSTNGSSRIALPYNLLLRPPPKLRFRYYL